MDFQVVGRRSRIPGKTMLILLVAPRGESSLPPRFVAGKDSPDAARTPHMSSVKLFGTPFQ